jgi:cephalosporin hydroxylase
MDEIEKFSQEVADNIRKMSNDSAVHGLSNIWVRETAPYKYSYNFSWMGRPIIQFPQDMIAMQEIIWRIKPRLIIETGIAHGGSLIFYASILELLGGDGVVLGIDIDIRAHNRVEIEKHPMSKRIKMIQGSAIDKDVTFQACEFSQGRSPVMVLLDSNHTHQHVLDELKVYSPLVTKDSYLVVFDTAVEDLPDELFKDRPWGKGNNPKTAVSEFLKSTDRFEVDKEVENKLLITVATGGYLKCIKD